MRLQILAVGKMKAGPEQELYARYSGRINKSGRNLHLTGPELFEIAESRQGTAMGRKSEEAEHLISRIAPGTSLVLLDERGKDISSEEFSNLLRSLQEGGSPAVAFAIGGPDGHGDEIKNRADRTIRFGSLTWPHQLARIMLVEQLYRAITILSGHPYHRE